MQTFSIILELLVVLVSLGIALRRKKKFGWFLALTFGIYVWYDAAKYYAWGVSADTLAWAFFIASLSALWAVWSIYRHYR